jgi:hypothetical protein
MERRYQAEFQEVGDPWGIVDRADPDGEPLIFLSRNLAREVSRAMNLAYSEGQWDAWARARRMLRDLDKVKG